jgi:ABC-type multidrug transport system ATPase subunit
MDNVEGLIFFPGREPGEVFGVLGLKGAGKTSLIQSLAGELQPTSGRC